MKMADDDRHTAPQMAPDKAEKTRNPDLSAWLIWAALTLVALAILPFAIRNHDMVRAFARMCGFDID